MYILYTVVLFLESRTAKQSAELQQHQATERRPGRGRRVWPQITMDPSGSKLWYLVNLSEPQVIVGK